MNSINIPGIIFGLIFWWFLLKYTFFLLQAVWKEVSPAVITTVEIIEKIIALPFAPFISLYYLINGRPETEQEKQMRESEEFKQRETVEGETRRREELEAIKKALELD